ncbi:MAG: hypothetical protein AAFQ82_03270, partial [Myxococcota bacterium]
MAVLIRLIGRCSGLALAVSVFSSCGDPLVDENFRGDVLFTLTGQVIPGNEDIDLPIDVRVSVFWSPELEGDTLLEQRASTSVVSQPAQFRIPLVETPRATERLGGDGGPFAIGRVAAYEDENANGMRDASELFLGVSGPVLIWAQSSLPASATPLAVEIEPGFQVIRTPLLCDVPAPPRSDDSDCGVELHAPCSSDAPCANGGFCMAELMDNWPNGACGVRDGMGPDVCRPTD